MRAPVLLFASTTTLSGNPRFFYIFMTFATGSIEKIIGIYLDKPLIMYYIVYMISYAEEIVKKISKELIPKEIFLHINNALIAIDATKDLNLFDIKQMKLSKETSRMYYRLRKGKYRAIFYFENNDIFVIALDKREEVYRKWQ
jgi:mRNA interferase RelE/StbE